jgi:hypothetical protein
MAHLIGIEAGGNQHMITVASEEESNILSVAVSGTLTKADYEDFVPMVEAWIRQRNKPRIFIEYENFHGWTPVALWEDIKFGAKHFDDVDRIAMVGEKSWEKGMAVFCELFTTAEVGYFPTSDKEVAKQWIVS